MYKEAETKVVPLTREFAEEVATMPRWKGDRPLKPGRVAFLDSKLRNGEFHSPEWAFARLNGVMYRVNGQHSSNMLAAANGHFPKGMNVVVKVFVCETELDVAELYSQFDRAESSRNMRDIVTSHKIASPGLQDVPTRELQICVSAISTFFSLRGESKREDWARDARARLMHAHSDFIIWLHGSGLGAHRLMLRSAVVAAIFGTWKKHGHGAIEFWTQVAEASHPNNKHPTRRLNVLLVESIAKREGTQMGRRGNPSLSSSARSLFVRCIHAWNAVKANTTTDLKYYAKAPIPEIK